MCEIVNLRRARKKKARAESDAVAVAKRAQFGRSRVEREAAAKISDMAATRLDGHLRAAARSAQDDERQ